MASTIQVTAIKYYSEIKNGSTFALNPLDFSTHCKGNLIEKLKAEITVRVQTRMELLSWTVTGGDTLTISSGSFIEQGFAVGDSVYLTFQTLGNFTFTITSLSPTVMVTTGAALPVGSYGTSSPGDIIKNLSPLDAIKYKFGFPGNDSPNTFISAVDQTTLQYKAEGMRAAAPSSVSAVWDGTIKGSQTGGLEVAWLADILDDGELNSVGVLIPGSPVTSIQEFRIEHTFNYPDWYLQNELENISTGIRPERIEAGLDIKQIVDFEFRTALSNPNTSKTGSLDYILGKTNYFGENYSDNATQYTVADVVLTDVPTGSTVSNIDVGSTTRITFSVLSANSTFITTDPVVFYHNYLPTSSVYQDSTETLTDNWILETLRETIDTAGSSGTVINNFSAALISAGQIDCTVDIIYPAGDQNRLENGFNYLLAIGVADDILSTDLSDKTVLPVQVGSYEKNNDIAGLMDVDKLEVYTHPMQFVDGVSSGFTDLNAWVQDGVMFDWRFSLDLSLTAVLERYRIQLVALKVSDNSFFVLDSVEYDLSTQVIVPVVGSPTDVQAIEIDKTRGFPLAEGSEFNYVKLTTDTNDGTSQFYEGQTGFKVNWQSWLELPEADTIFYDPAEEFNGLNSKASNYSLKKGYEIRVIINADVSQGGIDTNYIFKSPTVGIFDFEEQDGSPITWSCIKETFDTDGANLGGRIQTTADTDLKFTYTPDAAPGLASLYWGELRMEEVNNPGFSICELSTFRPSKDNNLLKPLPGESFTKLSVVAGLVCLEATIDYTKLDPSKSYNIYGRMGLVDQALPALPTIKVAISGTTIQDDGDFFVFQQSEVMVNSVLKDNFFNSLEGDYIFKTADNATVGGAPYDKATWTGVAAEASFATLAGKMAINSTDWVFIEQTNTAYTIEGLIIEFERIAVAQGTTFITLVMPVNSIDQDVKIWSDRKWEAVTASLGVGVDDGTQMALRTLDTTGEDWTLFPVKTTFNDTTINAVLAPSVDGVKHCLHIFRNFRNGSIVNSLTIEMNYISSEDVEKSMEIFQGEIRPEFRPFGNCADWGPFPNVDQPHATTDPLDTALLDLLDVIQFGNPFTLSFWILTRTGLAGNDRQILLTPFNQGLSAAEGGSSLQLAFNTITGGRLLYALTENGGGSTGASQEWDGAYPSAQRTHVVMTHDGSFNATTGQPVTGVNMWINGRRNIAGETNTSASVGIGAGGVGTSRPSDSKYYHGRWNLASLGTYKQPELTERIQVFDKELNAEEVLELYHNIDAARGGSPTVTGIFRDWDFSAHAAGVVPDLTGSGFDMTIVTGGAQPGNPDFY